MYLLQEKTDAFVVCTASNAPLRYRVGEVLRITLSDGDANCYRVLLARSGQTILPPGVGPHTQGRVYRIIGRQMSYDPAIL